MLRSLVLAMLLVGGAGCAKKSSDAAPPCGAVAAKFLVIAQMDIDRAARDNRADAGTRRAVLDQLPAMRDALAYACTEAKWTASVRKCLVDAVDHVGFEACQTQLTEAQRAALAKSAAGTTASSSP